MLNRLLSAISPDYCYHCDQIGSLFCDDCKNYYTEQPFEQCINCLAPTSSSSLCPEHRSPYGQAWCVASRSSSVGRLVDDYKFHRLQAAASILAQLLDQQLPYFDEQTILVPVPTTPRNIRIRGYDHIELVVRRLAELRDLRYAQSLGRRSNTTQHFAKSLAQRRQQAKDFFEIIAPVDPGSHYLVIDDIYTTGSTIEAAAKCLRSAGASQVSIALIVRQEVSY